MHAHKMFALLLVSVAVVDVSAGVSGGTQNRPAAASEIAAPISGAMTFQAWKNLRLEEAKLIFERLTFELQSDRTALVDRGPGERQAVVRPSPVIANARPTVTATKSSNRSESRIEQARINLEIAQDLTMIDYLQIYLPQVKSRDALLDVARRMAPEDVVELMVSYQKLSSGGQIAEHSAANSPRLSPRPL